MIDDTEDRLAILIIHPSDVVGILSGEKRITNLPSDARLVRAVAPYEILGWALCFKHQSFAVVERGLNIPNIWAEVEITEPPLTLDELIDERIMKETINDSDRPDA